MNPHDIAPRLGHSLVRLGATHLPDAPRAGRSRGGRSVHALGPSSHGAGLPVRSQLVAPSSPAARELLARLRPPGPVPHSGGDRFPS